MCMAIYKLFMKLIEAAMYIFVYIVVKEESCSFWLNRMIN